MLEFTPVWVPCYGTYAYNMVLIYPQTFCQSLLGAMLWHLPRLCTTISYTGQLYTHEGVSYLRIPILAMTVAQVPLPVLRPQLPPNRRGIVYFTTVANLSLAN